MNTNPCIDDDAENEDVEDDNDDDDWNINDDADDDATWLGIVWHLVGL